VIEAKPLSRKANVMKKMTSLVEWTSAWTTETILKGSLEEIPNRCCDVQNIEQEMIEIENHQFGAFYRTSEVGVPESQYG
jgi:hypothetical protein